MSTSLALADRLTADSIPSALMDAEIECLVLPLFNPYIDRARLGNKPGNVVVHYGEERDRHGTRVARPFTRSADSALQLKPLGWRITDVVEDENGDFRVDLYCDKNWSSSCGTGSSFARALTAASLRAIAVEFKV